jgi:hypothetical protein
MELAFLGDRVQPDLGGFQKADDRPELLPAKPGFRYHQGAAQDATPGSTGQLPREKHHSQSVGFGHMGMLPRDLLEWLPGFFRKPDWRLRRAEYLLTTRSRLDRRIDDKLIKRARAELAKKLLRDADSSARPSTIQAVHNLSRANDSPLRWQVEAYLLTDLTFQDIGAIVGLSPTFISTYHDLAFEVRPRRRATDWLTLHAMGSRRRLGFEYAWKQIARAGGSKVLEVAIAITTGSPFPVWMQRTFKSPRLDDALLRMRGKLLIGAMLARTREQWRALVDLRRKLRRLVPTTRDEKSEARLQAMLSFLTGAAPNGYTLDENQPIRPPELFTFATTTPGDSSSQPQAAPGAYPSSVPAAVSVQNRRKSRGHHQQYEAAASQDPSELPQDVVEFMADDAEGTGPLAFVRVAIDETKWSAFDDESEPRLATISIRV